LWVVEPVRGRMVHTKLESVSWLRSEGIFCTVRVLCACGRVCVCVCVLRCVVRGTSRKRGKSG
jgi:hypothetical protein